MASLVATAQTGDAQLEDLRSKLDGLLRDADGGITLHVSHAPPASARDRNWLPAPARGRFVLCCRFYEPREELLQQKWRMPPVRELQQPRL